tara:strand:- start:35 stop:871 length:837 start_codon:yes stop_codon:yes gene_type:complete
MKLEDKFDDIIKFGFLKHQKSFINYLLLKLNRKSITILNEDFKAQPEKIELLREIILFQNNVSESLNMPDRRINKSLTLIKDSFFNLIHKNSNHIDFFIDIVNDSFENCGKNIEYFGEYDEEMDPRRRIIHINDIIPYNTPHITDLKRSEYEKFSDEKFKQITQEFKSFLLDLNNKKLISVGVFIAYANIQLPKAYDILFDLRNKERFWKVKSIIRYAFNYRDFFHTDLWAGHHSHCFVEIIGQVPEIVNEIKHKTLDEFHPGIGLCTAHDWNFIKNN